MKRLFKDPLFYKDWKSSKWICLLMTLILFWDKTSRASSDLNIQKYQMVMDKSFVFDKMWFNQFLLGWSSVKTTLVLGVIVLLCILLFKGEKQDSTCDLLHSMPFTRKDIMISKIKVGILTIVIPFLINFIILTFFYFNNKSYIGSSYVDIPKFYFINLLFSLFLFMFLVFMQSIVGQYFAAAVIAPITLFVPNMFAAYIVDLIRFSKGLEYDSPKLMVLDQFVRNSNIYDIVNTKALDRVEKGPDGEQMRNIDRFIYENFDIKIMILIILIVVFAILSVIIYNRIKLERINQLIIFKPVETVFKLGVAICVGMIFSQMFGYPKGAEPVPNMPLIYITLLIGTIIGYFLAKLVVKFCSR
ncbi:ABC transporter permease [Clostridium sporogenes]|uniref:ABC transporter permease n=1 Tax=Clostridium botulinum TaxID=1491 RepID=A0A6M0SZW8_CLOBO|nr:ABC transporter permease subunit [Clostridium sporogenes]NFA61048.1 ABC transporter permease [Clostridium botulinum]NFI73774.1 ABC transporter permease [Clostridium sporogenes]NFL73636.1 ABC transporter permease [Clostridium sporogenes]NFM24098.1 ABC transporter permease [Clostridium sporogenes]NFP61648.1 ABC transporter permease [Clostridium sporogenes]